MPADDVARALMALDDEGVRDRVRGGDMAALGDLQLSAKEEGLVKAVASEEMDPEVSGFEWGSSSMFQAASYVQGNMFDAGLQSSYKSYLGSRYGNVSGMLNSGCACPPMGAQAGGASQLMR